MTTSSTTLADLAALVQQFESPDWTAIKALGVLYAHRMDRSATPAICAAMDKLSDADMMPILMQLAHMIVVYDLPELEQLLMERFLSPPPTKRRGERRGFESLSLKKRG